MADSYKSLAQGALPSVAAIIHAPSAAGAGHMSILEGGTITNVDTVSRTFQIWINGTDDAHAKLGTAAVPITLGPSESYRMDADEKWALGPSQAMYGVGSVSGKLVYEFSGDDVS